MKRKINTLCFLIICIVAASVIMPMYKTGYYFGAGLKSGLETTDDEMTIDNYNPVGVTFEPNVKTITNTTDTIVDIKSGMSMPMIHGESILYVPNCDATTWLSIMSSLCGIIIVILLILLLIYFIKFIVNINKNIVFDNRNVSILNKLGVLLLVISTLQLISGISGEIYVSSLNYKFDGYTYSYLWNIPWSNLLFGLTALLMSKIWSNGIKMREDQELTI